jgi:hypothetical protein
MLGALRAFGFFERETNAECTQGLWFLLRPPASDVTTGART